MKIVKTTLFATAFAGLTLAGCETATRTQKAQPLVLVVVPLWEQL